jgi:hypothetical protein
MNASERENAEIRILDCGILRSLDWEKFSAM